MDGVAIPRNEGEASRFSTVSLRLSKQISLGSRASADVIVEGFNIFNTRNDLARVGVFGTGAVPGIARADLRASDGCRRPAFVPTRLSREVLMTRSVVSDLRTLGPWFGPSDLDSLARAATLAVTLPACSSSPGEQEHAPAESAPAGPVISLGQSELENRGVSAAASGDRVVAVWAATKDGSTDIQAVMSEDAGATFSAPVRVNDLPGDARVNGEQPPRVAVAGLQVVVVWQSRRTGQPEVRAARSTDGGRSFAKAVTIHAQRPHGFAWMVLCRPGAKWRGASGLA